MGIPRLSASSLVVAALATWLVPACGGDDDTGSGGVACGGTTCSAGQTCCIDCDGRGSCSTGGCPGYACPPALDTGPGGGDGGPAPGGDGSAEDAGRPDAAPPPDGGGGCGGMTCGAGEQCCPVSCEGDVACAATCPDLACALCGGGTTGVCSEGLACSCCPIGGPAQACLCSTPCSSSADCADPARPTCNLPTFGGTGFCAPADFRCCWECNCAAPDTPVATPAGERPIAELAVGDLVYAPGAYGTVVAAVVEVGRRAAPPGHRMVRIELASGRTILLSPAHPTADGRRVDELVAGDLLDGQRVRSVARVAYGHAWTHDIRTAAPSGAYYAAGALIGTTLAGPTEPASGHAAARATACGR